MTPFFSIITPTIQRKSLVQCCKSVDTQTFTNWEHLIQVDKVVFDVDMMWEVGNGKFQRKIQQCAIEHKNFGNTCRHNACQRATGKYIIYLDCDNHFCHDEALSDLAAAIEGADFPDWGIVPMWRHGRPFFTDPPRSCHVDTANLFVKREIGQWPDGPEYTMDGIFVEQLQSHPEYVYKALPDVRPVINMPYSSEGK